MSSPIISRILALCLIATSCQALVAQSQTVRDLSSPRLGHIPVCLYPSTLRMINVSDNPELNLLVRDIKHLKFLAVRPQIIAPSSVDSLVQVIVDEEKFASVLTMTGPGQEMNLLLHEKKSTMVLVTVADGSIKLVECKGKVNPMQLLNAITALKEDETLMDLGLHEFFDIGKDMQSWD